MNLIGHGLKPAHGGKQYGEVAVYDTMAYVAILDKGFDVWNISTPSNPVFKTTVVTGSPTANEGSADIEVSPDGKYLFLSWSDFKDDADADADKAGVEVFDIGANPAQPSSVDRYFKDHAVHSITVWGDKLLLNDNLDAFDDGGRVHFVDMAPIRTGGQPTHIGDWYSDRNVNQSYRVAAHDTYVATYSGTPYAFVSYNVGGGTQVIDISDLSSLGLNDPDPVATYLPSPIDLTHSSALTGNGYLYICYEDLTRSYTESGGVDVRQFTGSALSGSEHPNWDHDNLNDQGFLHSVHNPWINGNRLYLSHYGHGVRVLDISNRTSPSEIGYYITGDNEGGGGGNDPKCLGVRYATIGGKGYLVASDMRTGLWILDPEPKGGTVKAPLTLTKAITHTLTSDMKITSTGSLTIIGT